MLTAFGTLSCPTKMEKSNGNFEVKMYVKQTKDCYKIMMTLTTSFWQLEYNIDLVIVKDPLNNFTALRQNYPPVGNKLQVEFTSDNTLTGSGFQLIFEDSKAIYLYFDIASPAPIFPLLFT